MAPFYIGTLIGTSLITASTGYLHLGYQRFFHQPLRFRQTHLIGATFGVAIFVLRFASGGAQDFVSVLYLGTSLNVALTIKTVRQCLRSEPLPSGRAALFVLSVYGAANLAMFPIAYLEPVHYVNGYPEAPWLSITTIPLLLMALATYIMALVLKLERATEKQRVLATHDVMTGLLNRRAFYETVASFINRPGAVAILDLDHFKAINDNYGHKAGDDVLIRFANAAEPLLPRDALFCRLGGEEFGVILLDCDAKYAKQVLEDVRSVTSALEFVSADGKPFEITLSCGFTTSNDLAGEIDRTMIRADNALYEAKKNGRNCVMSYEDINPGHSEVLKLTDVPLRKTQRV